MSAAAESLNSVRSSIREQELANGREAGSVELIAVSKTFPAEQIRPILEAGQRIFGENRVQEAMGKWPDLKGAFPDAEVHLIGPLQSNKAREAVATFDVIHTVDREKIARALKDEMVKQGRDLPCFVQVNTGAEPQKAGIAPAEAGDFLKLCRDHIGLNVVGLMCIPPVDDAPGSHFALLEKMAAELGLSQLSMGMSSDFDVAIGFGATHVRVGSAIFGARDYG